MGARVLLSSVFGPYCQDDQYGSRAITQWSSFTIKSRAEQGSFSLRVFHPSLGIRLIQANISAPCTCLIFRRWRSSNTRSRATTTTSCISSIVANVGKVKKMCEVVRALSPRSRIVVGGHVAAIPALETMVDADHFVKGEGVEWMRTLLGEDPQRPFAILPSARSFGFSFHGPASAVPRAAMPAVVAPSVGCPMGCDFCCTSAFFGGKGRSHFLQRRQRAVRCPLRHRLATAFIGFFLLDENFLLHRDRAMQLLTRMRERNKSWGALRLLVRERHCAILRIETLVELGVSWVWLGLESPRSDYKKLENADTVQNGPVSS